MNRRNRRPITVMLMCLTVGIAICVGARADEKKREPKAKEHALDKLTVFLGDWVLVGKDNKVTDKPGVRYTMISEGTAVMETLFFPHRMTTIYHADGDGVMMTHYCAMANQPQMKLTKSDKENVLYFDYSGGTNIDIEKDMHMHQLTITRIGDDRMRHEWVMYKGREKGQAVTLNFARKKK